MYKTFKIIAIVILSFSLSPVISGVANAQDYKGGYSQKKKEKKKDRAAKPIPKVFSSKVSNVEEAEKLDKIYDNLLISLWGYAATNFIYQNKLYSHIKPEKFHTTRYSKEFTGDMTKSMENLNNNYASMVEDVEKAQERYIEIKKNISMADHEILDKLWNEKISAFEEKYEEYFQMQGKFLNIYKNLVGFILKQGGSYYYKSADKQVYFYKFGGYKFYGQSIDKLNMIRFKQKKLLKTIPPANINVKL